jgi:hypothetical protein
MEQRLEEEKGGLYSVIQRDKQIAASKVAREVDDRRFPAIEV